MTTRQIRGRQTWMGYPLPPSSDTLACFFSPGVNEACDYRLLGGLRHFWFDVLRFVLDFIEQSKHEEYLMQAAVAKMPETRTDDIGRSVFAQVDELTLEVLDRRADEEVLPRSWLIARILQEWAADHEMASDDRTIDLEPPQNWQITVGELRATG